MIIGNGDIAKSLIDTNNLLFFASGVSNSAETDINQFTREIRLLMKQDKATHLVYFGSLSVFYADTKYSHHKQHMERLIKANFEKWTIVRLGNITWGKNPHTIINFLRKKIADGQPFEIKNVYRYVLGLEEFQHWMNMIPTWNCEMNLPGEFLKVEEIVRRIKKGEL